MEHIKERLREIFERFNLLEQPLKVEFAYLFGSIPEGLSGVLSDIDIAVYLNLKPSLDDELRLHLFLSRALHTDRIDLVILNTAKNIILKDEIIRKGVIVYDSNPLLRESFELRTLHDTIDFKDQRKVFLGR